MSLPDLKDHDIVLVLKSVYAINYSINLRFLIYLSLYKVWEDRWRPYN